MNKLLIVGTIGCNYAMHELSTLIATKLDATTITFATTEDVTTDMEDANCIIEDEVINLQHRHMLTLEELATRELNELYKSLEFHRGIVSDLEWYEIEEVKENRKRIFNMSNMHCSRNNIKLKQYSRQYKRRHKIIKKRK